MYLFSVDLATLKIIKKYLRSYIKVITSGLCQIWMLTSYYLSNVLIIVLLVC